MCELVPEHLKGDIKANDHGDCCHGHNAQALTLFAQPTLTLIQTTAKRLKVLKMSLS